MMFKVVLWLRSLLDLLLVVGVGEPMVDKHLFTDTQVNDSTLLRPSPPNASKRAEERGDRAEGNVATPRASPTRSTSGAVLSQA